MKGRHETREKAAAIQVICLGSGGGPSEDNVTGLLVRSIATNWARGSLLAVDAGSHMAAITRILEHDMPLVSETPDVEMEVRAEVQPEDSSPLSSSPPSSRDTPPPPPIPTILEAGPFAGLPLPNASARANAAHIVRNHVSTYLITHPHLDHLSGFAINTASFHATSRPKKLAAMPFTVDAIKRHIFNDVIWPNLTDEDGGVGFVTFQRLKEGGDVMVGEGEGRGYIEVCEGLGVKGFKISHGHCARSDSSAMQPHRSSLGNTSDTNYAGVHTPGGSVETKRSTSFSLLGDRGGYMSPNPGGQLAQGFVNEVPPSSIVDSTVYFIRDDATSREILIFGDVEPDSVSSAPRLNNIWREAAPKIASGVLVGMFIECSYDDSQPDAVLFGHMAPRHIVAELQALSELVKDEKVIRAQEKARRKRKRSAHYSSLPEPSSLSEAIEKKRSRSIAVGRSPGTPLRRSSQPLGVPEESAVPSPMSLPQSKGVEFSFDAPSVDATSVDAISVEAPLTGLRVVIIHVKDTLKDGPHVSERILSQLNDHAAALEEGGWGKLGCEFIISESGGDYMF
ncbi:hypothetical protein AAFC00_003159 [Neodothiora populina]|uniref:3',5'-cyclic-nucleotide phosphodiesterase n=1 Tax=Neodothiora populina TaxID=2781224 RepID=A0ABR3P9H8_9PEZI